jgi:sialate O-acetylesterase
MVRLFNLPALVGTARFFRICLGLLLPVVTAASRVFAQEPEKTEPVPSAPLWMPSFLSDHMVLQRQMPLPLWGRATPGATVTVTLAGNVQTTQAGEKGQWRITLPPLEAGGPHEITVISGADRKILRDVLVGEVWVASGQSNMRWSFCPGHEVTGGEEELANADAPRIRFFDPPAQNGVQGQDDLLSEWRLCNRETLLAGGFRGNPPPPSAVAYFFARKLEKDLGVPVGIISAAVGNSRIGFWKPESALGKGMIQPLVPYAIRGWIWYQGESNLMNGETPEYGAKMVDHIETWRRTWGQGDFPFYFVQLPPFLYSGVQRPNLTFDSKTLPQFREAQATALRLPHTGMAVITDLVDADKLRDIHPRHKKEVGQRLARLALARTYALPHVVDSGPTFHSAKVEGPAVRVRFTHAEGGLQTRNGSAPDWFEIAGADGVFRAAEARIEGESVLLSSAQVPNPVRVRLGWDETAQPNLMNQEGLPASSFRADALEKDHLP